MKSRWRLSVGASPLVLAILVGAMALVVSAQDGFIRVAPDDVVWKINAEGFYQAVIDGDPTKPGIYVIRVKFPPGVMSRPHTHNDTRYAIVLKGTWYTDVGSTFAPDKAIGLKPGSHMRHPAGAAHYDGAKDEEVIVQIVGTGPTVKTPVGPTTGKGN